MPKATNTTRKTRDSSTRRKSWTPPNRLDTPTPPEGYKYRWVRHEVVGKDDNANVYERNRQGYEVVMADELGDFKMDSVSDGKQSGAVRSGDLILTKVPLEIAEERQAYYEDRAELMRKAVDQELDRSFKPGDNMTKVDESESSVSYRGVKHDGGKLPEFDE